MGRANVVTSKDLHAWLGQMGVAVIDGRKGQRIEIDGAEIKVPHAGRPKDIVTQQTMRLLARALQAPIRDLTETILNRDLPSAGKTHAAPAAVDKSSVLGALRDLEEEARKLRKWVNSAHPSAATLGRIHGALVVALADVREVTAQTAGAAAAADQVELDSPDDAGYRPTRHDPLTVGAGPRATGAAARIVKKGQTETKFQVDEKEGS